MHHVNLIIQSLNKREKYYFAKLYHESKSKNFYKLYTAIEKNPYIQVDTLKLQFAGSTISKNIFTELHYLYEQLLRTLHIYRINSTDPELQTLKNLQYVKILLDKGENKLARKILMKAKKTAYYTEQYSLLIKIITIQEELDTSTIDSDLPRKMKKLQKERAQCLIHIENYFDLKKLRSKLIDLQYKEGLFIENPKRYRSVLKHPLLKKKKYASSLMSKNLWYFCKAMINHFKGKYDKARYFDEKRIFFMKKHPQLFPPIELIKAKNNLVFLLIDMEDYQAGRALIEGFSRFKSEKTIPVEMILYFENYLRLKLESFASNRIFLREFIPRSLSLLDQYRTSLNETQIDEWYQNVILGLVEIQDYSTAMKILNEWQHEKKIHYGNMTVQFLRIICFYESGAYDLVIHEISKWTRYLKKQKIESRTVELLVLFIRKSIKFPVETDTLRNALFKKFEKLRYDFRERKYFLEVNLWNWVCQG